MAPNKTNHPSRKGVEIEKHKGGRTARLNARFTEAEKSAIMAAAHAAGLSVSDYIVSLMAQAQPTPFAPDKSGLVQAQADTAKFVFIHDESDPS
jgi:uncharacterized protein (DUF1778 family)